MKRYSPFIIGCAILGLSACTGNPKADSFNVQGTITDMPKTMVYLEEIGLNNELKITDSAESGANGSFKLSCTKDKEQKMYRVKMGSRFILVLNDEPTVKLKADWDNIEQYAVTGSPGSSSLKKLVSQMYAYDKMFEALHMAADSINLSPQHDSLLIVAQKDYDSRMNEMRSYMKQYADTTRFLPVAILAALRVEDLLNDRPFLDKFTASLNKRFGNQTLVADFKRLINSFGGSTAKVKSSNVKLHAAAPDFSIKDLNGQAVTLSKYKGKYVLVDFWASWCPPCRKENPNVVAVYNSYKDKNFDILGVSLDEDKDKWKSAIKEDEISWTQTSELKGWKSSIVDLYGIESIPSNVLIDPDGNVVGINLMGDELKAKLDELLK